MRTELPNQPDADVVGPLVEEARRLLKEETQRLRAQAAALDYQRRALRRGIHVTTQTPSADRPRPGQAAC